MDKTLGYVPYGTGKVRPFDHVFNKSLELDPFKWPEQVAEVDAIVVWGGSDISPTIYGQPVNGAHASVELSLRDKIEVRLMELAIKYDVPIIGICRGAQLACALAGGKLFQDVNGHHGDHGIVTNDGRKFVTSSVHHQMMDVRGLGEADWELIAATEGAPTEPEIIYFPYIKALAIQGHPEFMSRDSKFVQYCMELTNQYIVKDTHDNGI